LNRAIVIHDCNHVGCVLTYHRGNVLRRCDENNHTSGQRDTTFVHLVRTDG
jgi:hypothetical protein